MISIFLNLENTKKPVFILVSEPKSNFDIDTYKL